MEKRETTQDGQKSKKKVKQESVSMVKNEQMKNDCNIKGSHVELTNKDFYKTDTYIKSLRNWRRRQGPSGTLPKIRMSSDKEIELVKDGRVTSSNDKKRSTIIKSRNNTKCEIYVPIFIGGFVGDFGFI